MTLKAAIIGCGKRGGNFAKACLDAGDVELVGFADPLDGAASKLAKEHSGKAFTDTGKMLAQVRPDFVCLVTRPSVRLAPIQQCAAAGVKAMVSEKPMSVSLGEARAIHQAADVSGMALSFCHQRRVDVQFIEAKRMLDAGEIGKLKHIDGHCDNFYDWGTHWFDMMHFFNAQTPAAWVMAQAQREDPKFVFDQPMDRCGISVVHFENDVTGTLHAGAAQGEQTRIRLIGDEGTLWVADGPKLELYNAKGKTVPDFGEEPLTGIPAAVLHAISSLRAGKKSLLDSGNALMATELIFASYLSAMRGEKVTLPLEIDDLALADVFAEASAKA